MQKKMYLLLTLFLYFYIKLNYILYDSLFLIISTYCNLNLKIYIKNIFIK